jgi:hypothetical protein
MNQPCPPCTAAQNYIHAIDAQREAAQVNRHTDADAASVRAAQAAWTEAKSQRHTCRDRTEEAA